MVANHSHPAYVRLGAETVAKRAAELQAMMHSCRLCPHECNVNRLGGEIGLCRVGDSPKVSSFGPHFGEETPLVGRCGSGTIFLTCCNLRCLFCQNYDISQLDRGDEVTTERLAEMMLNLQTQGCHNINWVTPTHQVPVLVEGTRIALERGLNLPIVYNCGGYESVETLGLLDGIVDIYMPDAKYGDSEVGAKLSGAKFYWERCREALAEMHRQVGDLEIDAEGVARRGLLVRHLVLPENLAKTEIVMEYIASLSQDTYVNVMAQYRPQHRAYEVDDLARHITKQEFEWAVQMALDAGLHRLDKRWAGL